MAYLVTGVFGGRGLVLCVGPDGHVAIEVLAAADCGGCLESESIGNTPAPASIADELPACPCDDTALTGGELVARKGEATRASDVDVVLGPLAPVGLLPTLFVAPTSAARDRFADANRAARTRTRSVVMRV